MTSEMHYSKAPITEAIIEIRVGASDEMDLVVLKQAGESVSRDYPHEEGIFETIGHMEVQPGIGGSTSIRQQPLGYKWANEERNQIVQFRRTGFTFSRLAPYDQWSSFRDEAYRLWGFFRDLAGVREITRLAVRYINRIDVPAPRVELTDYFRTSPEVSPDLPQEIEQFFMQLRLPQPAIHGTAVLNQTLIPPAREGTTSIILDIDLFRDRNLMQDENDIWNFFEELHRVKNEVFEACITDTTRRLFD